MATASPTGAVRVSSATPPAAVPPNIRPSQNGGGSALHKRLFAKHPKSPAAKSDLVTGGERLLGSIQGRAPQQAYLEDLSFSHESDSSLPAWDKKPPIPSSVLTSPSRGDASPPARARPAPPDPALPPSSREDVSRHSLPMSFELADVSARVVSARVREFDDGVETAEYCILVSLAGSALRVVRMALRDSHGVVVDTQNGLPLRSDDLAATVRIIRSGQAKPSPKNGSTHSKHRSPAIPGTSPSVLTSATSGFDPMSPVSPVASSMSFAVFRRFSDFRKLDLNIRQELSSPTGLISERIIEAIAHGDKLLRKQACRDARAHANAVAASLPSLPPGSWWRSVEPQFVSSRKHKLDSYLSDLMKLVCLRQPSEKGFTGIAALDHLSKPFPPNPSDLGRSRALASFLKCLTTGAMSSSMPEAYVNRLASTSLKIMQLEGTLVHDGGAPPHLSPVGGRSILSVNRSTELSVIEERVRDGTLYLHPLPMSSTASRAHSVELFSPAVVPVVAAAECVPAIDLAGSKPLSPLRRPDKAAHSDWEDTRILDGGLPPLPEEFE
jgi:hypothetical protein